MSLSRILTSLFLSHSLLKPINWLSKQREWRARWTLNWCWTITIDILSLSLLIQNDTFVMLALLTTACLFSLAWTTSRRTRSSYVGAVFYRQQEDVFNSEVKPVELRVASHPAFVLTFHICFLVPFDSDCIHLADDRVLLAVREAFVHTNQQRSCWSTDKDHLPERVETRPIDICCPDPRNNDEPMTTNSKIFTCKWSFFIFNSSWKAREISSSSWRLFSSDWLRAWRRRAMSFS